MYKKFKSFIEFDRSKFMEDMMKLWIDRDVLKHLELNL